MIAAILGTIFQMAVLLFLSPFLSRLRTDAESAPANPPRTARLATLSASYTSCAKKAW